MSRVLALAALVIAVLAGWTLVMRRSADALVVYCAHDLQFSQQIIEEFERETGIRVVLVGDTEATKSLGLVERLLVEKDNPRCDVFWNNQTLGTCHLAREGALEPYKGPGYERIPERYKDPDGLWTGFAGRIRVWIINRDRMPATQEAAEQRLAGEDLSRLAIAGAMFGTTLSHASVLWQEWGPERFQEWHRSLKERNCRIMPGNASVKNVVAEGVCDLGWTDTDDFFVARDDGFPVEMLPIRVNGRTLCIPNSVAIIRGTRKQSAARKLVDFLLSEAVELRLAVSQARQVPLGPVPDDQLTDDVRLQKQWAEESVEMRQYLDARLACLEWLRKETAP